MFYQINGSKSSPQKRKKKDEKWEVAKKNVGTSIHRLLLDTLKVKQ